MPWYYASAVLATMLTKRAADNETAEQTHARRLAEEKARHERAVTALRAESETARKSRHPELRIDAAEAVATTARHQEYDELINSDVPYLSEVGALLRTEDNGRTGSRSYDFFKTLQQKSGADSIAALSPELLSYGLFTQALQPKLQKAIRAQTVPERTAMLGELKDSAARLRDGFVRSGITRQFDFGISYGSHIRPSITRARLGLPASEAEDVEMRRDAYANSGAGSALTQLAASTGANFFPGFIPGSRQVRDFYRSGMATPDVDDSPSTRVAHLGGNVLATAAQAGLLAPSLATASGSVPTKAGLAYLRKMFSRPELMATPLKSHSLSRGIVASLGESRLPGSALYNLARAGGPNATRIVPRVLQYPGAALHLQRDLALGSGLLYGGKAVYDNTGAIRDGLSLLTENGRKSLFNRTYENATGPTREYAERLTGADLKPYSDELGDLLYTYLTEADSSEYAPPAQHAAASSGQALLSTNTLPSYMARHGLANALGNVDVTRENTLGIFKIPSLMENLSNPLSWIRKPQAAGTVVSRLSDSLVRPKFDEFSHRSLQQLDTMPEWLRIATMPVRANPEAASLTGNIVFKPAEVARGIGETAATALRNTSDNYSSATNTVNRALEYAGGLFGSSMRAADKASQASAAQLTTPARLAAIR